MTDVSAWAAIDDNNNTASPAGWPEGMMPSGVNNTARANMGALKRWRDQSQPTVTATGTANAQIITYPVAPAALANGDVFSFYSVAANTGPATLTVNAQAAKSVRNALGAALTGGEIPAGALVTVAYDGTNFRLANPNAVMKTGDTMTGLLVMTAGVGSYALYQSVVSGQHTWSAGAYPDGSYHILDQTLGDRLILNTAGLVNAPVGIGTPLVSGGYSGAGTLRAYNSTDDICFVWFGNEVYYRINNTTQKQIVSGTVGSLGYSAGMGGPTGVALIGGQGGTSYGSYVDFVSDARIKENIEPSDVDALGVIERIPVSRFNIKAPVAAWLGTEGKGAEARAEAMQIAAMPGAPACHVPIGFVAQDLARHVAEAVHVIPQPEGSGSPLPRDLHTVSMDSLVPYLVRAVQQMAARIEQLETALIK